jgi:hypothetical protein
MFVEKHDTVFTAPTPCSACFVWHNSVCATKKASHSSIYMGNGGKRKPALSGQDQQLPVTENW